MQPKAHLAAAFPMLFADAPNPADCPHRNCGYSYHHVTSGGIAVALVVAIVVAALLVLLAIALVIRLRRRRRRV
jgi:hypothetical protein